MSCLLFEDYVEKYRADLTRPMQRNAIDRAVESLVAPCEAHPGLYRYLTAEPCVEEPKQYSAARLLGRPPWGADLSDLD